MPVSYTHLLIGELGQTAVAQEHAVLVAGGNLVAHHVKGEKMVKSQDVYKRQAFYNALVVYHKSLPFTMLFSQLARFFSRKFEKRGF